MIGLWTSALLVLGAATERAAATYGQGWTEYDSKIWCDVEQHQPIHHGRSTYCTLDFTQTMGGFCEVEFDAANAYWQYGVGIVEDMGCKGAQYCEYVCWDYQPSAALQLPPANFSVSNGTFPCQLVPSVNNMRTRINGSEAALFCSLSKLGVNSTRGLCSLERDAADNAWYMVSSGWCYDQTCAYTCLFSDELESDLVFGDFSFAPEPGRDLPNSLQYDFCALATYTDDLSVQSNCQIISHNPPGTDIGWSVLAGSNNCSYVCADIFPKGHRPNITSHTTVLTTTRSTTTRTTATSTTAAQTTAMAASNSTSATSSGGGNSSTADSTTAAATGDSAPPLDGSSSSIVDTVNAPTHEQIPVYIWGVIGGLGVVVLALAVVVTVLVCRARSRDSGYRLLLADGGE